MLVLAGEDKVARWGSAFAGDGHLLDGHCWVSVLLGASMGLDGSVVAGRKA